METDRIRQLIADTLNVEFERVTPEKSFADDLNADSLDRVEIIMQLEDELGIEIPDEAAENIVTVGDALEAIRRITG